MEIYLNECSFHEQFFERLLLEQAFRSFFTVLDKVVDLHVPYTFYWDQTRGHKAFPEEVLVASLNRIPDRSLCVAILSLLCGRLVTKTWREDQVHSVEDTWKWEGEDVGDTSLAEMAERKLRRDDLVSTLLNFPQSRFTPRLKLSVTKNETPACELDCVENKVQLANWLGESLDPADIRYDYMSIVPPRDHETVLRDFIRFDKTTRREGGKRVYKEVDQQRYWYIDSLHFGRAAHLEVFDRHGSHIGEANLEGELDTAKRDPNKHFDP